MTELNKPFHSTDFGKLFVGDSKEILNNPTLQEYKGKINLIFTSPPFPLNRKKKYGNLQGNDYILWISEFASLFKDYLSNDGSIVLEVGNAWNKGLPTTSTLPIESLLSFKRHGDLHLCQEFIYYNPARLPTPVQWVNKERIRVKDSFTRIWWLSPTPRPYANNRNVLVEYSNRMKDLLEKGEYNSGKRPSEHKIGISSFLKDNGGAIPPNVIVATNTKSRDIYLDYCKVKNVKPHPARMPEEIVEFFIKFLTKENDIVLDPFAGSNTTGATAQKLKRKWVSIEINKDYAFSSIGRLI
jgi:site-specific DNA-methyltransferase (cytosine-N4-specific)